jgi:hypothetical protein
MHGYQITKINNGIKEATSVMVSNEPTSGYQNCNISQILKFGGYVKDIFEDLNYYLPWPIPF